MKIKFQGFEKKEKDTYGYRGWLISDNIAKRALAILGHLIVAYLFIFVIALVILVAFNIISGLIGRIF